MKNKTLKIVTAALGVFCLASCGENVSKTDIKTFDGIGYQERDFVGATRLNKTIFMGTTYQIDLDSMPEKYKSKVTFESVDEDIVKVSETGLINPVSEGITNVILKDDKGNIVSKIHILVAKDDQANTISTLQNIKQSYNNGYVAPTRVHKYEYAFEEYYKDGVINHGYHSCEETFYDKENAIFFIGGDDVMRYAHNGAREIGTGYWHFQVIGMQTRMVHITETAKNYFDFNSADYGLLKYRAIEDVLDLFFVSGKKIINDMLEEYSGKEDFLTFCDAYPTDTSLKCYADEDNNVGATIVYKNVPGVVDVEDELEYLDMYEGTQYIENDEISFIYNGNKCIGYDIDATYDYNYDGSKWQRSFRRSMSFDNDYEPTIFDYSDKEMQEMGFKKVDYMYDL